LILGYGNNKKCCYHNLIKIAKYLEKESADMVLDEEELF